MLPILRFLVLLTGWLFCFSTSLFAQVHSNRAESLKSLQDEKVQVLFGAQFLHLQWPDGEMKAVLSTCDSMYIRQEGKESLIIEEQNRFGKWESRSLPLPKSKQDKKEAKNTASPMPASHQDSILKSLQQSPTFLIEPIQDQLEAQSYTIEGKSYEVIYWTSYSCYDPMCGSKHGHMRVATQLAYSKELGMLCGAYGFSIRLPDDQVPLALMQKVLKHYELRPEHKKAYFKFAER